jgi:hypothetical protein
MAETSDHVQAFKFSIAETIALTAGQITNAP